MEIPLQSPGTIIHDSSNKNIKIIGSSKSNLNPKQTTQFRFDEKSETRNKLRQGARTHNKFNEVIKNKSTRNGQSVSQTDCSVKVKENVSVGVISSEQGRRTVTLQDYFTNTTPAKRISNRLWPALTTNTHSSDDRLKNETSRKDSLPKTFASILKRNGDLEWSPLQKDKVIYAKNEIQDNIDVKCVSPMLDGGVLAQTEQKPMSKLGSTIVHNDIKRNESISVSQYSKVQDENHEISLESHNEIYIREMKGKKKRQVIKEYRKVQSQLLSEEKRRSREEEIRKMLVAPKDQKVKIVSQSAMKLWSRPAAPPLQQPNPVINISANEFPILGEWKPNVVRQPNVVWQQEHLEPSIPKPKVINSRPSMYKKKKDRIEVDIMKALKVVTSSDKDKEGGKKVAKGVQRRVKVALPCGNSLDSSNPERRRGKVRLKPPRLSRLKTIILKQRALRLRQRLLEHSAGITNLSVEFGGTNPTFCMSPPDDQGRDTKLYVKCPIQQTGVTPVDLTEKALVMEHVDKLQNRVPSIKHNSAAHKDVDTENLLQCVASLQNSTNLSIQFPSLLQKGTVVPDSMKADGTPISNEALVKRPADAACCHVNPLQCDTKIQSRTEDSTKHVGTVQGNTEHVDGNREPLKGNIQVATSKTLEPSSLNTKVMVGVSPSVNLKKLGIDGSNLGRDGPSVMMKNPTTEALQPRTVQHSRNFREYCDYRPTPELNTHVTAMLKDLIRFQDRAFERDPLRAHAKRRYVVGLREVVKYLGLRKLKLVIVAPDLEKLDSMDEAVARLKTAAGANNVPCVFSLRRKQLGYVTLKKVPISCIGVVNYDGAEAHVKAMLAEVAVCQAVYDSANGIKRDSSQDEPVVPNGAEEMSKEDPVRKEVIASLLTKLCDKEPGSNRTPQFLQAIERPLTRDQ